MPKTQDSIKSDSIKTESKVDSIKLKSGSSKVDSIKTESMTDSSLSKVGIKNGLAVS